MWVIPKYCTLVRFKMRSKAFSPEYTIIDLKRLVFKAYHQIYFFKYFLPKSLNCLCDDSMILEHVLSKDTSFPYFPKVKPIIDFWTYSLIRLDLKSNNHHSFNFSFWVSGKSYPNHHCKSTSKFSSNLQVKRYTS